MTDKPMLSAAFVAKHPKQSEAIAAVIILGLGAVWVAVYATGNGSVAFVAFLLWDCDRVGGRAASVVNYAILGAVCGVVYYFAREFGEIILRWITQA